MKRKICFVTGSRAEYSRIKSIMYAVDQNPKLELQVVVMGSHLIRKYGMTIENIKQDGFKVDAVAYIIVEGENPVTMTKSTGLALIELASILNELKPDIVIAPTDRFETLPVAVAAAYMNIKVAHIQGGELSGTIDGTIRHAISKFSDLHFPASEKSRETLLKLGEHPDTVFNFGCPATDLLLQAPIQDAPSVLTEMNKKTLELDVNRDYLLILQHPVTTEFGGGHDQIQETLTALKGLDYQIILLWPNADAGSEEIVTGIRKFLRFSEMKNVFIYRHFSNNIFINLMRNAKCVVGNSSAGLRETCYFGTPVVNIGTRQQDREKGKNVVDAPYNAQAIQRAITAQLAHGPYAVEKLFGNGDSGKKISNVLQTFEFKKGYRQLTYGF